jgi:hypothetical protein
MPFTYFAHQLFVLPFKQARPRWFDGTALCVGSMAPDFAYALERTWLLVGTHSVPAQLFWSLPVGCGLTWLIRHRLAQPLGAQLPGALGAEVQALARSRHHPIVTAWSAVLGGLTHIFADGFTHSRGWAWDRYAFLHQVLPGGVPLPLALQYLVSLLGGALGYLWLAQLVAARRISAWNGSAGEPRSEELRAPWFWPALASGSLLSACVGVFASVGYRDLGIGIMRGSALELLVLVALVFRLRRTQSLSAAE